MQIEFDEIDQEILKNRIFLREKIEGARIGDYIHMLDGTLRRFTHDWSDSIQVTSKEGCYDVSFYLGSSGYASFSGSLDPSISKEKIKNTCENKLGQFWFFHHDHARAHNGVKVNVLCRVFKEIL